MDLTPMRYKDYTWPHNPTTYGVTWRRAVAGGKIPFGGSWMQDLGLRWRVMTGEGEFAGPGAYGEFLRLAEVFQDQSAGVLVHPLWQAANAYFVSLRLEQEPRPDYVRYSFAFWEDDSWYTGLATRVTGAETGDSAAAGANTSASTGAGYHRVVKGDTLWAIARSYGLSLTELIALNPQIKNPNLIRVGDEVRVR